MNDEIFDRVEKFVKKGGRGYHFSMNYNTRLYEDLRIYGDDASEFFIAFGKEFNVDVSKFMAADYFKGEGFDIIAPIINFIKRRKQKSKIYKAFTLGQLVKAIKAGKLDEEVINSND